MPRSGAIVCSRSCLLLPRKVYQPPKFRCESMPMDLVWTICTLSGAVVWLSILLLPWRPWSTRELLDAGSPLPEEDLSDITVLIPARNEAEMIKTTLPALNDFEDILGDVIGGLEQDRQIDGVATSTGYHFI